jgi:hypothetical protein
MASLAGIRCVANLRRQGGKQIDVTHERSSLTRSTAPSDKPECMHRRRFASEERGCPSAWVVVRGRALRNGVHTDATWA